MAQQTNAATDEPTTITGDRDLDVAVDALHELAHVERLLRATDVKDVVVNVDDSNARIWFTTSLFDDDCRGSKKAALANELAATSAWGLATIDDDFEDPEAGEIESMLTVLYDPQDQEGDE